MLARQMEWVPTLKEFLVLVLIMASLSFFFFQNLFTLEQLGIFHAICMQDLVLFNWRWNKKGK